MVTVKSGWESVTDRGKWAARGASFVAKVKATKVVWFPPEPVETGKQTVSTATKTSGQATRKASKKTTGAAKKGAGGAKKGATGTRKKA